MDGKDATIRLIEALEAAQVAYMLVGSLSSNYHGIARATKDADIVVSASGSDLVQALRHLSPDLRMDRQMTFETATGTTRHIVAVGVRGDDLDWDYLLKWTDLHGTRTLLEEIQTSLPPSKRSRAADNS